MKTTRIMAIAVLSVGFGSALYQVDAAGSKSGATEHATGSTARRASPRNRHRRRERADPEPAGEATGQPCHRQPPWGGLGLAADTPARLSSTPTSFRARIRIARSMMSLLASTGPVRRGSRARRPSSGERERP